jgi:hypothetical protein
MSAATGAVVRVISGSGYAFDNPDAVSLDGTHVWVSNGAENTVTGFRA